MTVAGVWKEEFGQFHIQNPFGRGKGTLHLIKYHALPANLLSFSLIAPALLAKDFGLMRESGMKYCVQIDIHQIQQIPVVAAGDRIDRLIWESDCINKGTHRAFKQFHKGRLHRIFVGATEDRVLQNMKNASGVFRQGLEGNAKGFIRVGPI